MAGIKKLQEELIFLKKDVLGILLYGSRAKRKHGEKSDFDICIVVPNKKNILKKVYRHMDVVGKKYDFYTFEELPLYMKIEVIKHHKLILSEHKYDLYEYLYKYRKIWEDQKHRQKITKKQVLEFTKKL